MHRWLTGPQFQQSQKSHGWTEAYCRYLDYLTTVNIIYNPTGPERSRYHNMLVLRFKRWKESRKDVKSRRFKLAARSLAVIRHQERRDHTLTFGSRKEKGKYRSMKCCDQNLSGKVGNIEKSWIAGVIFIFDNLARTKCMARTTGLA